MPATMVRQPALKVNRRNSDGDTIIELEGKLDSSLPAEVREEAIALAKPGCRVVLDLSRLNEISPTGVRMLLMFFRRVRAAGGTISVTGASPKVFEVAEAAGYLPLFQKTAPVASVPTRAMVSRIDAYPTATIAGFAVRPGSPNLLGATLVSGGVNFAVYSQYATACTLVLFETGGRQPLAEIPFPAAFRVGNVFAMTVFDLDVDNLDYGFRMEGPFDPQAGHRFDPTKVLLDPMARTVCGRGVWGMRPETLEQ